MNNIIKSLRVATENQVKSKIKLELEKKLSHLADEMKSEGGTIDAVIVDSKIKVDANGFSSELMEKIQEALK